MPLVVATVRPYVRLALGLVGLAVASAGFCIRVQAQTLRVGVSGSAPFVIREGDATQGISIDVWRDFASAEGLSYRLIQQTSTAASITNVASGELDVAIGPISITSDRLMIDGIEFTQPYYISHVGLLVSERSPGLWRRLRPFFGWACLASSPLSGGDKQVGRFGWSDLPPELFPVQGCSA